MNRNVTPARFSSSDVLKQMLDLSRFEPRGRLIENDESTALSKRARDLEHLPLTDRQVACALTDVDLEIPDLKFFAALAANLPQRMIPRKSGAGR